MTIITDSGDDFFGRQKMEMTFLFNNSRESATKPSKIVFLFAIIFMPFLPAVYSKSIVREALGRLGFVVTISPSSMMDILGPSICYIS